MAATWLILGPPGLLQYTELRQNAVRVASATPLPQRSNRSSTPEQLGEGDYFHNGNSVLPEIRQWHAYLKDNLRKNDWITDHVLDIIDDHLLQTDPQNRFSAERLCAELNRIKERHPHMTRSGMSQAVRIAVTGVETQLKSQPAAPIWGQDNTIQSRKALKSRGHLELPRYNVARISDMLGARLARPQLTVSTSVYTTGNNGFMPTIETGDGFTSDHALQRRSTSASQRQSLMLARSRAKSAEGLSKHAAQSIFDAHYAKESEGKEKTEPKKHRWIPGKRSNNKAKDELLSRHYAKRDIVSIAHANPPRNHC